MQTDIQRRAQLIVQGRLNNTEIADLTNCSRSTVRNWRQRLKELEATEEDLAAFDELELRQLVTPEFFERKHAFHEPDWERVFSEALNRGVRISTLYQEYADKMPEDARAMSLSTFYRTVRAHAAKSNITISFEYEPGEMIQADFVGRKRAKQPILLDEDGQEIDFDIFCATSVLSRKIYVLVIESQSKIPVLSAFISMLEFFGGSPVLVDIDNFKAAVTKPRRKGHDAEVSPDFQELADHYQFGLKATRVRKPRDKALVENAVGIVQDEVLAPLRDRRFFSLAEMNKAISERLEMLNERPMTTGAGASRNELFDVKDSKGYRGLPEHPYEPGQWVIDARVGLDYHVHVHGSRYSVPAKLANEVVNAKVTVTSVHIYFKGRAVATHLRSEAVGKQITNPDHMPPAHRHATLERLSGLKALVRDIGPNAERLIDQHFRTAKNTKSTAKTAQRLRAMAAEYPNDRVDAACLRALDVEKCGAWNVENILLNGLDQLQEPVRGDEPMPVPATNVRGAAYFATLFSQRSGEQDV